MPPNDPKAPKKKPAPAKPKPKKETYDYFYCTNQKCSFHAMFLLKDAPKNLSENATCPTCKTGKIALIQTNSMMALATSSAVPAGMRT